MKTRVVVSAVALVAGLGWTAHGNGGVATVGHSMPVVHRLPVSHSGVGGRSFGTFALHGWLYIRATCRGTGKFEVELISPHWKVSASPDCRDLSRKHPLKWGSNFGVHHHLAQIEVRTGTHNKWSITIVKRRPVGWG
jgi:hypothetical protein